MKALRVTIVDHRNTLKTGLLVRTINAKDEKSELNCLFLFVIGQSPFVVKPHRIQNLSHGVTCYYRDIVDLSVEEILVDFKSQLVIVNVNLLLTLFSH